MSRLTSLVVLAVVTGGATVVHGADTSIPGEQRAGIAPQALNDALNAFAHQSGLHLIYASDLANGRRSNGAPPGLSPGETLERILSGTGLTAKWLNERTISIRAEGEDEPDYHGVSDQQESPSSNGQSDAQSDKNKLAPDSTATSEGPIAPPTSESEKAALSEVVITGSHIHGASPASPVIVLDRADIDASGYATTGDLIRSLPQSFGGGQNPGNNGTNQASAAYNFNSSSSANLRGLGSDATLTLVNGHRLAFDGVSDSVDISQIPLAAVSRIEILTDGASALYGSDAVAGVVNVILKPDYSGAETTLRYGDSTSGGASQRDVSQTFGLSGERGGFIATYEHFGQSQLLASERSFSSRTFNPTSLVPADTRNTGLFSGHYELIPSIAIFGDAIVTRRDPQSIGGAPGRVYSTQEPTNQYGLSTGFRFSLPSDWTASITGTLARDDATNYQYLNGSPITAYTFDNSTWSAEAEATGPLATLWSGPLEIALDGGYRKEAMDLNFSGITNASRNIVYEALELQIPLVLKDSSRVGLERLDLSVADRHERYSDFGDTNNPKFGLVYTPVSDVTLKGTWGRSFHAPELYEKYGARLTLAEDTALLGVNAPGKVGLIGSGGNPNLGAETSHGWTASLDFTPSWLAGAKATLSGYGLDYKNRITAPISSSVGAIRNPIYEPFINQAPSAALIANVTSPPVVLYNYSGVQTFSPANVFAYYQTYYQNVARQTASGIDLLLDYKRTTPIGLIDPSLDFTRSELHQYATSNSPVATLSGTIFNVPRDRARAGFTWARGGWGSSTFVNFTSSEINNTGTYQRASTIFNGHVGSWTTIDTQATYEMRQGQHVLDNWKMALTIQNLCNRLPPYVPQTATAGQYAGIGYDPANASPLERFISITISKKF